MRSILLPALCSALLAAPAHALIDVNSNGLSDLWEKLFNNNQLFPSNFDPLADPDGDGWTNAQEATAGTNPFDANAPAGLVRPEISFTPGTYEESDTPAQPPADPPPGDPFTPGSLLPAGPPPVLIDPPVVTLTWPTLKGKTYQVAISENLVDWTPASAVFMGDGIPLSFESENVNSDGTVPTKVFMRVIIGDNDSDGDGLTDWEEGKNDTDPFSKDTDKDGIPDKLDGNPGSLTNPSISTSATYADPDGRGLANAGLLTGLRAHWDFEDTPVPGITLFGKIEARAENKASTAPAWPVLVPFSQGGVPHSQRPGFVSAGLPLSNKAIYGDAKVFQNITGAFTLSFWHRFEKDSVKTSGGIYQCLWSLCESRPNSSPATINSNTLAIRKKNATQEEIYLGAYTWTSGGGQPHSVLGGTSFTRPVGTADDGNWHHYTIVRAGGKYTLVIDGETIPSINNTTVNWLPVQMSLPTPTTASNWHYDWNVFGRMAPNVPQNQTVGTFDRIRLWDRALTTAQTTALYRENTDNDGLWDVTEVKTALWRDMNSNALRDAGETTYSSHPLEWHADDRDTDGDGLTDKYEQDVSLTDIGDPDSDGDLIPDGWEVANGLDPKNATGMNGAAGDREPDGVSNLGEYRNASDPNVADTDGDGTSDAVEINGPDGNPDTDDGSNPNDPSDGGQQLPPAARLTINLGIGDQSGSESEDYVMNIFRIDPASGQEKRIHTLRSGGFGNYKERPLSIFRKGETYTFQIDWQGSKLTSRAASPGVTAEGPDFDYTFKVQPQGTYLGKLIPSWDSRTGSLVHPTPLGATGASNVATTQQEFEENFERRRIAIVAPKLEWQAFGNFENVEPHIDPWTDEEKGKRIFPGQKNPKSYQLQNKLVLMATGGLKGVECYVKSFDIDDSTDEAFDVDILTPDPVIDPFGKLGDDNKTDYRNTNGPGQFWNGVQWAANTHHEKFDATGRARFDFRIGMQPGNNYRVVGSAGDAVAYADVQVYIPEDSTYLGPELGQNGSTIASEPLTVWRRLWVENDSMTAIPTDQFGYKRNDLSWDINPATVYNTLVSPTTTTFSIPKINDQSSFDDLAYGRIIVHGTSYPVTDTDHYGQSPYLVTVAGQINGLPQNPVFRLYDDDDFGLTTPSLPRLDLADDLMKKFFAPAFIEITDSGDYNQTKTVPFRVHDPLLPELASITSDARELKEKMSLWVAPITAAYQFNIDEDKEPIHELPTEGATTPIRGVEQSVVYVESCRDWYDNHFRIAANGSNPQIAIDARKNLKNYIVAQASHEIGHQPGVQDGDIHHAEGGLMRTGAVNNLTHPDKESFEAATILRFRNSQKWSK